MSKKEQLDPKSQKIRQNWTRIKHSKSQVNGETEISLHNQILRTEAKARQF
ncbi:YpzG family protein [Lysinibacillus odysseyi]|uniref:YpzG family protein n=1 Tax=Lysinibacillus odysseyi TaxID=202611 RepID=UPI0009DF9A9E|nr:YpzG family protein [Lysinibacillus odysseyi]